MNKLERALPWMLVTVMAAGAALTIGASVAAAEEDKGPPFGERKKKPAPKPPTRTWTLEQKGARSFVFDFDFKPGIPNAGQLTEIMVTLNEIPKRPHPTFGSRVPIQEARLVIELSSPTGAVVGRYLAHDIPLSRGKYGIHITPAEDGIYTMTLRGSTPDGEALKGELKLPVNVWPLPEALQGSGAAGKKSGRRRPIKL